MGVSSIYKRGTGLRKARYGLITALSLGQSGMLTAYCHFESTRQEWLNLNLDPHEIKGNRRKVGEL